MSVAAAERRLRAVLEGQVRAAEPMARHTTFRVGGPADLFIVCDTVSDLSEALSVLSDEGVPAVVLGKGSNVLVADDGYRGAVLTLGTQFKTHTVEGVRIKAGAACTLAYLVHDAFSRGLGGLEFAVGIPGTLGGALAMNAGSRGVWIDSVVESVTLYVPRSGLVRLRGREVAWGYRQSGLSERGVIVEAVLALTLADTARIRAEMEASLERRRATQPMGVPSAGSVFVNPEGESAGRLIEDLGLKGACVGGARVSDVHANFIVNEGGATARDVVALIEMVRTAVRETHGIELGTEIRFLGSFGEPQAG